MLLENIRNKMYYLVVYGEDDDDDDDDDCDDDDDDDGHMKMTMKAITLSAVLFSKSLLCWSLASKRART